MNQPPIVDIYCRTATDGLETHTSLERQEVSLVLGVISEVEREKELETSLTDPQL